MGVQTGRVNDRLCQHGVPLPFSSRPVVGHRLYNPAILGTVSPLSATFRLVAVYPDDASTVDQLSVLAVDDFCEVRGECAGRSATGRRKEIEMWTRNQIRGYGNAVRTLLQILHQLVRRKNPRLRRKQRPYDLFSHIRLKLPHLLPCQPLERDVADLLLLQQL